MAVDVDFDQGELDSNTQIILQASTKAQAEAVQKSYSILNDGINTFIKNYELAYQEINAFQNGLKEIIKNWHRIKNSLIISTQNYKESFQYLEYIKSRQSFMEKNFNERLKKITLDIYLLAFKIQQYLNAALGQKVATAYVFEQRGEIAPKVSSLVSTDRFRRNIKRASVIIEFDNCVLHRRWCRHGAMNSQQIGTVGESILAN